MTRAVQLKSWGPPNELSSSLSSLAFRVGRPLLTTMLLGTVVLLIVAPACGEEGIGDPCTPEQEFDSTFLGFDAKEVNVESKSFQCRTRLCLVNHFQGRVSCPYGQGLGGEAPPNGAPCTIPGAATPIAGAKDPTTNDFIDQKNKSEVKAQCLDRVADKAVYCSCRCADINNNKPSDQTFCECPDGYSCERLVTSIGQNTNEGLTGSYCIKSGTKYDPTTACTQGECDKNNKAAVCQ